MMQFEIIKKQFKGELNNCEWSISYHIFRYKLFITTFCTQIYRPTERNGTSRQYIKETQG